MVKVTRTATSDAIAKDAIEESLVVCRNTCGGDVTCRKKCDPKFCYQNTADCLPDTEDNYINISFLFNIWKEDRCKKWKMRLSIELLP